MYKARKRSKDEDNIILVSNRKGNVSREKELITDLLELTSSVEYHHIVDRKIN